MKSLFIPARMLLVLGSTLMLAACNKDGDDDYGNGGDGGETPPNTVTIASMAFSPGSLTVKAGTTVTWTNNDNAPHTVTADNGSFASNALNKGDSYSHQFTAAGTYPYHCEIHPSMKASVVAN